MQLMLQLMMMPQLMIEDAIDAHIFCNNYRKYLFVNFPSIFYSFQCLHIVRFE